MSTVGFWVVAFLVSAKVGVFRTPAPFEWVGELAAGLIALAVAFVVALALDLYVGDFPPFEMTEFRAPGAVDTYHWWRF